MKPMLAGTDSSSLIRSLHAVKSRFARVHRLSLRCALRGSAGVLFLGGLLASNAATIKKANNTADLNLSSSWVGGVVPTESDVASWDSTVSAANTVGLGADASWKGINVPTGSGLVTISAGNTLTL
ncbi:MAG: hypothetical protein ACTHKU_05340, partial [Verrucomicrobiota bacterium]